MIKSTGIFYKDEYYQQVIGMDGYEPEAMDRTIAFVLATDIAKRPLKLQMSAEDKENASDKEVKAFRARFKDIDEEDLEPLPLQTYDGNVAVRRTVDNLLAAGIKQIIVAAKKPVLKGVKDALKDADAQVIAYDDKEVEKLDAKSDGIQIELISRGQIMWAVSQLGDVDGFDSLMVLHADLVAFEPRHYRKLRAIFEQDQGVDFVSSYVEWRTCVPLLLPFDFIEKLSAPIEGKLPKAQGAHQLACRLYNARHAIMDEDKLIGSNPVAVGSTEPEAMPKSALKTVTSARHKATATEKRHALATGAKADPHVVAARKFLKELDASLEKDPIEGLDEAQAWALRNRCDFPLLATNDNAGLAYLDAAATSLQPSSVINAGDEFAVHYDANIWRGVYGNSMTATAKYQAAREKVAALINADPRDVIFTGNTTTSLNLVAQGWAAQNLQAGDLILVMCNEHHSNLIPWQRVAREVGGEIAYIPVDANGYADWDAYEKLLSRGPKLVSAAQVSNVIGVENPIRKMAKAAHKCGAVFVMDAAQSAPHMPIDVTKLGVDFIAFSGHKMQAPTGIGVLWANPELVGDMCPMQIGGGTISEVSYEGTYWRQSPYAFEPGTPPIQQAIALGAAADYLQMIGMDNVQKHAAAMTQYALRAASLLPSVSIIGNHKGKSGSCGLLSYEFDRLDSTQTSILLGKMGVAVRSGAHCAVQLALALGVPGSVRISFGPYTTKADIEAWAYAMKVIEGFTRDEAPRS